MVKNQELYSVLKGWNEDTSSYNVFARKGKTDKITIPEISMKPGARSHVFCPAVLISGCKKILVRKTEIRKVGLQKSLSSRGLKIGRVNVWSSDGC